MFEFGLVTKNGPQRYGRNRFNEIHLNPTQSCVATVTGDGHQDAQRGIAADEEAMKAEGFIWDRWSLSTYFNVEGEASK